MLYPPHLRHVLAHHSKIPVEVGWSQVQGVEGVELGRFALAPLAHLGRGQVVRRVHIAGLPVARDVALHRAVLGVGRFVAAAEGALAGREVVAGGGGEGAGGGEGGYWEGS